MNKILLLYGSSGCAVCNYRIFDDDIFAFVDRKKKYKSNMMTLLNAYFAILFIFRIHFGLQLIIN